MKPDEKRERVRLIRVARARASYGKKKTLLMEAAADLHRAAWSMLSGQYVEHDEQAKYAVFLLVRTNPKRLRDIVDAVCKLTGKPRDKFPRGPDLVDAYELCESFPPTLREVKSTFITRFDKLKWNGGDEHNPHAGDFSASKTLKSLGLPLKKSKRGPCTGYKPLYRVRGKKETPRKV